MVDLARRRTATVCAILVVGAAAIATMRMWPLDEHRNQGLRHAVIGKTLAELRLEPLTGSSSTVTGRDIEGHVTVITFWGTWCPPCWQEFPNLVRLWNTFGQQSTAKFLMVSCEEPGQDEESLRRETQRFLRRFDSKIPTYSDPDEASRAALRRVTGSATKYPTTVILDTQGVIRAVWEGYEPGIEGQIEDVLRVLVSSR